MTTRKELTAAIRERYHHASSVDRGRILDEFVAVTGNDHDKGSDMPDQRRATPFYFDLNGRGNGNSVFIGPTRSGKTDYEKLKLTPADFESIRGQGKEAA